ncbi:MAG: hypothetical protein Q6K99_05215 [Thermostichales cyanobacterium BF4_bins_65]
MNARYEAQMLGRMLASAFNLGELRTVKLHFKQGRSLELVLSNRTAA